MSALTVATLTLGRFRLYGRRDQGVRPGAGAGSGVGRGGPEEGRPEEVFWLWSSGSTQSSI
jgi:hypothetical protein